MREPSIQLSLSLPVFHPLLTLCLLALSCLLLAVYKTLLDASPLDWVRVVAGHKMALEDGE